MARYIAPDKKLKQTDVGGFRYSVKKDGLYHVENKSHARAMKAEGFVEASLMGATLNNNLGFNCKNCGFGSWFKKCSKCGYSNGVEMDKTNG